MWFLQIYWHGLPIYTAFHKNIPVGISGCKKNRLNNKEMNWLELNKRIRIKKGVA